MFKFVKSALVHIVGWTISLAIMAVMIGLLVAFPFQTIVVIILLAILSKK